MTFCVICEKYEKTLVFFTYVYYFTFIKIYKAISIHFILITKCKEKIFLCGWYLVHRYKLQCSFVSWCVYDLIFSIFNFFP